MVSMYFNDFSQISLNLFGRIFDIDNDGVHDTVTTDFHLTYFLTLDASHRRFTESKLDSRDIKFRLSMIYDSKIRKICTQSI